MKNKKTRSAQFCLMVSFAALLVPTVLFVARINLPQDADGWTIFTPSDDSRICYIAADGNDATAQYYGKNDTVVGSNPLRPAGAIKAYATFAAAYADTRTGYPDWILFKRGDTFTEYLGTIIRSGRTANEPFLIGSYGSFGNCPIIKTGADKGIRITTETTYLAFMGLDFYAHTRDPDNGGSLTSGDLGLWIYMQDVRNATGILIEGCKFRFYENNVIQNVGAGDVDIVIRRCSFTDNYSETAHSQGVFVSNVNEILFEENILIHNGWYQQQNGGGKDGGQATQFNHNIYWCIAKNALISKSIFIDGSSAGIKLTAERKTSSTKITNNLFVGNEIQISMGNNYQAPENAFRFPNTTISDNVATHSGRLNPTNRGIGWGFWLCGLDGATISRNLLINADSCVTNGQAFATNSDESRNVNWYGNVVYNWGTSQGLRISSGSSGSSNIAFRNNRIQLPGISNGYVIYSDYDVRREWSFSGNQYFADSQSFFNDVNNVDLSTWNSWSGDDAKWSLMNFPDATRDVDTYMASIGKTGTIEAFVEACRSQDRFNWDSKITVDSVNPWIQKGFWAKAIPMHVR